MWRQQEKIPGLTFAETDYINMAQELALRNVQRTEAILDEQTTRIANPDRQLRFAFVRPALSLGPWDPRRVLREPRSRRKPGAGAVGARRAGVHEPSIAPHTRRTIYPSRASSCSREIQRTGDIFFPLDWSTAVLSGHNSRSAAEIVTAFLESQKDYPPRLRRVIEQSADQLFRGWLASQN